MARKSTIAVEALNILSNSSRRATSQRTLLLDLIRRSGGHMDAYELYQRARERHASINLSTVYRNLQLFKNLGLVDEHHFADEHHHYEAKPATEHQHLVCVNCGKVVEFNYPLSHLREDVGKRYNFDIRTIEVNIAGLCSSCRKEKKNDSDKR